MSLMAIIAVPAIVASTSSITVPPIISIIAVPAISSTAIVPVIAETWIAFGALILCKGFARGRGGLLVGWRWGKRLCRAWF
jgi:hypothetical protein